VVARLLLALSLAALTWSEVGCASSREPPLFQLDWQVVPAPRGPSVKGHLVNRGSLPARDLRLLVEGLDDSGHVLTKTLGVLSQIVESGGSTPFDVPVPGTAASYRVSVLSYEWVLPPASTGRR
jgi:hypothetical protein